MSATFKLQTFSEVSCVDRPCQTHVTERLLPIIQSLKVKRWMIVTQNRMLPVHMILEVTTPVTRDQLRCTYQLSGCELVLSNTFKNRTLKSYTLLVHIFGFVHPTRTKIPPFDSAFQALYSARTFVNLQCNANALKCFIVLFIVFFNFIANPVE